MRPAGLVRPCNEVRGGRGDQIRNPANDAADDASRDYGLKLFLKQIKRRDDCSQTGNGHGEEMNGPCAKGTKNDPDDCANHDNCQESDVVNHGKTLPSAS